MNKRLGGYVRMNVEDRRQAVAELAAQGESNREIAGVLGVDEGTIRNDKRAENSANQGASLEGSIGDSAENSAPLNAVAALAASDAVVAQSKIADARRIAESNNHALADARVAPIAGKYRCIVVDPPWPTQKFEREGFGRSLYPGKLAQRYQHPSDVPIVAPERS